MTSNRSDRTRVVTSCLHLYLVRNEDSVVDVMTSLLSGQQPGRSWFDSEQGQGGFLFQTVSGARGYFPRGCGGWEVKLIAQLHLVCLFAFGATAHSGPGPPHLRGF
jgi:hypothetical protein